MKTITLTGDQLEFLRAALNRLIMDTSDNKQARKATVIDRKLRDAANATGSVKIRATDDAVTVIVRAGSLTFEIPGMLTGSDLAKVLDACGIQNEYEYKDKDAQ